MVNIRKPVNVYGLLLSIAPAKKPGRGFYLTGEEPQLILTVKNPGQQRRSGTIVITWNMGIMTVRPVKIDILPGKTFRYKLPTEWLCSPGYPVYEVRMMGEPEALVADKITWDAVRAATVHTLCSYRVVGREDYEQSEKRHYELLVAMRSGVR